MEIPEALHEVFLKQHEASRASPPLSCEERRLRLGRLAEAIRSLSPRIVQALDEDYGSRSAYETLLTEVHLTLSQARYIRRRVHRWMRPRRCPVSLPFWPAGARVVYQPLGVVGIVAPWNYPFHLALMPFLAALAAGNRIILKPSEVTPRTAGLLEELVNSTFEPEWAAVVTGGAEVGKALSRLPFDGLFFTGSAAVGRSVLEAASRHLVPVTLELGGKSPAILGPGYSIEKFAERVIAGKLFNAGQTCIAPDYLLVPPGSVEPLLEALEAAISRMYPTLLENPDYTAIIHDRHYRRLEHLVLEAAEKGATIREVSPAREQGLAGRRKFPPTLVVGATDDMALMQEEIFGPVLPVRVTGSLEEAIRYVNSRPRPLALYYFDTDRCRIRHVLESTCSGGVCINDTVIQAAQDALPFGGVGLSGMGAYHGRKGFETFSHARSVLHQARWSPAGLLRPPYGRLARRLLRILVPTGVGKP